MSSFAVDSTPTLAAFSSMNSLELTMKVAASCKPAKETEFLSLSLTAIIFMICFSIEPSSKFALVMVINRLLSTS